MTYLRASLRSVGESGPDPTNLFPSWVTRTPVTEAVADRVFLVDYLKYNPDQFGPVSDPVNYELDLGPGRGFTNMVLRIRGRYSIGGAAWSIAPQIWCSLPKRALGRLHGTAGETDAGLGRGVYWNWWGSIQGSGHQTTRATVDAYKIDVYGTKPEYGVTNPYTVQFNLGWWVPTKDSGLITKPTDAIQSTTGRPAQWNYMVPMRAIDSTAPSGSPNDFRIRFPVEFGFVAQRAQFSGMIGNWRSALQSAADDPERPENWIWGISVQQVSDSTSLSDWPQGTKTRMNAHGQLGEVNLNFPTLTTWTSLTAAQAPIRI